MPRLPHRTITRIEANTARKEVAARSATFPESLDNRAKVIADNLEFRLKAAIRGAYTKAATGRFEQRLQVQAFNDGRARIQVILPSLRETKFLTNLGGSGRFKDFPVQSYYIFARGFKNLFADAVSDKKERRRIFKSTQKRGRGSRLKVPRRKQGYNLTLSHGGLRRNITDALGALEPDERSAGFVYVLWVRHPGFARDVVSEVVQAAGAGYQAEILEVANQHWLRSKASVTKSSIPQARPIIRKAPGSDLIALGKAARERTVTPFTGAEGPRQGTLFFHELGFRTNLLEE